MQSTPASKARVNALNEAPTRRATATTATASGAIAMGVTDDLAHSSIRFGLGRFTTEEEVDYVADLVVGKVNKLRDMSPLSEMHKEGIDIASEQWAAH